MPPEAPVSSTTRGLCDDGIGHLLWLIR